jgi:nucleotide-binding universal stress UspA family protein
MANFIQKPALTKDTQMVYKTILVHINNQRRTQALLASAVNIARQNSAHLIGLSVVPPIIVAPDSYAGAPPIMIDGHREMYRAEEARCMSIFQKATAGQNFQVEWRSLDAGALVVAEIVISQGRTVDLIVVSQADKAWPSSVMLDATERIIIESGRPVLVIPNNGRQLSRLTRAVVGWNGRREATRAVFDALPFLKQVDEVKVLCVNPQEEGGTEEALPGAEICRALSRHGVKCEAIEVARPRIGVGEILLSRVKEFDADLLVTDIRVSASSSSAVPHVMSFSI